MTFPNILSVSRIFLSIPIIILFEYELILLSIFTFIIASITDYLDGYFARKNSQVSHTGALLDLLADKVFVSVLLIWMTFHFDSILVLISSILIVSREISISYLRLFIISKSKNIDETKSDLLGKYKTAFQMIGLGLILVSPLVSDILMLSVGFLFLSALVSWYSLIQYLNKWIL
tara:strand:- start:94 stop:618 length:525 start_codon:yes stop_codon:yes gene_type:complete